MEMGFKWDFAYEILPQMLLATLNTIIAAGVGYAIALVVGLFFLFFDATVEASSLKKVRRTVARLQLEILELKDKSSKIAGQQMAVLEPQNEKIESLTRENLELSKKLKLSHGIGMGKLDTAIAERLTEINDMNDVLKKKKKYIYVKIF